MRKGRGSETPRAERPSLEQRDAPMGHQPSVHHTRPAEAAVTDLPNGSAIVPSCYLCLSRLPPLRPGEMPGRFGVWDVHAACGAAAEKARGEGK